MLTNFYFHKTMKALLIYGIKAKSTDCLTDSLTHSLNQKLKAPEQIAMKFRTYFPLGPEERDLKNSVVFIFIISKDYKILLIITMY